MKPRMVHAITQSCYDLSNILSLLNNLVQEGVTLLTYVSYNQYVIQYSIVV